MNIKNLLIVNAIFAVLCGLGLIFTPEQLITPYHISYDLGTKFMAQILGGLLLGIGVLSYQARTIKDKDTLKIISTGFLVSHLSALLVALYYLLTRQLGSSVMVDITLHGLFTLGFLHLGLLKNKSLRQFYSKDYKE